MHPSTATESITLSKTTNEQSTAYATGYGLTSNTWGASQSPVGMTKESSLTSNEQTTAVTTETSDKLTSKLSTLHSSTDVISSSEPETTTKTSTEQTTTVDICFLYTSTESNGTLPVAASGIHHADTFANITTDMCNNDAENVPTFCECDNEGVWTTIQRRLDGCVDFYRNWTEYKQGFGNINGEYWLGNDAIHQITSTVSYTLKVVLTDWIGATKYAKYATFTIADETDGYRLTLGSYSGSAGNSMSQNNGQQFSTWDRDNDLYADVSCAQADSSAWWYNHCGIANLNGLYLDANAEGSPRTPKGIFWYHWHGWYYSFKETKMMIKLA